MSEVKRINLALQGWADGGRAGARASLRTFWTELGSMAISSPIQRTPLDRLQGNWNLDASPASLRADLPNVHDAVILDGEPYRDGGFRGNPPIWPFINHLRKPRCRLDRNRSSRPRGRAAQQCRGRQPAERDHLRRRADGGDGRHRLKSILIHSIGDPESLSPLGAVSKFNIEPEFLKYLFGLGRKAATGWLTTTFDKVGVESSIDIRARFL